MMRSLSRFPDESSFSRFSLVGWATHPTPKLALLLQREVDRPGAKQHPYPCPEAAVVRGYEADMLAGRSVKFHRLIHEGVMSIKPMRARRNFPCDGLSIV